MNRNTVTFVYIKKFVVAVAYFLNKNNIPDFTKNETFEEFMKGLRHETRGSSIPKIKLYPFQL